MDLCCKCDIGHTLYTVQANANSLTCRKRRVKCDEGKPRCATCVKSERKCTYAPDTTVDTVVARSDSVNASTPPSRGEGSASTVSPAISKKSFPGNLDSKLYQSPDQSFESPLTNVPSVPSPNSAPLEWYDLLAEDAINNIDKYNLNLDLETTSLSRRQSPDSNKTDEESQVQSLQAEQQHTPSLCEQWNSRDNIPLNDEELILLQHYVEVLGPMMDVCDSSKQFTTTVPRLAVHNVGLLKSLLAVSARHKAIGEPVHHPNLPVTVSDTTKSSESLLQVATQYYYETLQYLSQNLLYSSYSQSREIIATALLISTYVSSIYSILGDICKLTMRD